MATLDATAHDPSHRSRSRVPINRRTWIVGVAGAALLAGIVGWAVLRESRPPADLSIAVLPFDYIDNQDDQGFADVFTEALIDALARIPGARVVDSASSFAFRHSTLEAPAIAGSLDVAYLVVGSFRATGERISITVQLGGADGVMMWSDVYTPGVSGVLDSAEEIAAAVAEALGVEPADQPRP